LSSGLHLKQYGGQAALAAVQSNANGNNDKNMTPSSYALIFHSTGVWNARKIASGNALISISQNQGIQKISL
jgi:hypothetical protein